MKGILLSAGFTILATTSMAQIKNVPADVVRGNVQAVVVTGYELVDHNGESIKKPVNTRYKYNEKRQLTEEIKYGRDGSIFMNTQNKYTAQGISECYAWCADASMSKQIALTYDNRGTILSEQDTYADAARNINYTYRYNNADRQLDEEAHFPDGSAYRTHTYSYDTAGNLTGITTYSKNKPAGRYAFTYDTAGNRTAMYRYDAGDHLEDRITYEYTRPDAQGNWQQKTTLKNEKVIGSVQRKITYYHAGR